MEESEEEQRSCWNSINSSWIWFEAGTLHGKDIPIIPFIINISDEEIEEFIKQLPPFISQIQVITNVNELIDIVSGYTFKFVDVFPKDKEELNRRVLKKLKQVKLTFILKNGNYSGQSKRRMDVASLMQFKMHFCVILLSPSFFYKK